LSAGLPKRRNKAREPSVPSPVTQEDRDDL
jgi:hypothetical protein